MFLQLLHQPVYKQLHLSDMFETLTKFVQLLIFTAQISAAGGTILLLVGRLNLELTIFFSPETPYHSAAVPEDCFITNSRWAFAFFSDAGWVC